MGYKKRNNHVRVKFIKGHIRRSIYPDNYAFLTKLEGTEGFFRVMGLYAHHCKDIPERYRAILQDYSISGDIRASTKKINNGVPEKSVYSYLYNHIYNRLPKLIEFVNKEFSND